MIAKAGNGNIDLDLDLDVPRDVHSPHLVSARAGNGKITVRIAN